MTVSISAILSFISDVLSGGYGSQTAVFRRILSGMALLLSHCTVFFGFCLWQIAEASCQLSLQNVTIEICAFPGGLIV